MDKVTNIYVNNKNLAFSHAYYGNQGFPIVISFSLARLCVYCCCNLLPLY